LFFCSALDIIFNNSIHTMKENKFDKKGIKNRSPLWIHNSHSASLSMNHRISPAKLARRTFSGGVRED
jgi:hypothetical protein